MKALFISTDKKIFEENSSVRKRMVEYGTLFEELHVVVFSKPEIRNPKSEINSKSKISENVWVYPTNSKNKLFYIIDAFKIGKALSSKLKASSCVISAQDPFETGIVGLMIKLLCKMPLQIQVHTDFANKYFITSSFLNALRFPLGIFILSFADSVRAVSKRVASHVVSLSHNVSVLPIFTGIQSSIDEEQKFKGLKNKIVILSVCRLEKEKDLGTALRAFKKVLERGIEAKFVVVGNGKEKSGLENLARELGIQKSIEFAGWKENVSDYYNAANIYISTSLYEGYGMSMIEAGLRAMPMVISDAGIAGEILKDGESALVCKQKDVEGFAEGLIKLVSDRTFALKLGENAKKAAKENLVSHDEYLNKYKQSLQEAINFSNSELGVFKKNILLRYLVSGVCAALTQMALLFAFTDFLGIWYLYSSMLSFLIAISVSFVLQKFWTFKDRDMERAHHQFAKYLFVAVLSLVVNTACMYALVDLFSLWYILAQVFTGVFVAVINFLMYKFFIFNKNSHV